MAKAQKSKNAKPVPYFEVVVKGVSVEFSPHAKAAMKAVNSVVNDNSIFKDGKAPAELRNKLHRLNGKDTVIYQIENGRKFPITKDALNRHIDRQKTANEEKKVEEFKQALNDAAKMFRSASAN